MKQDRSMRGAASYLWNSPTFTTWASFAGRFLSLLLLLPLALSHLSPAEFSVWQLFGNVTLFGAILDLGLSPTLSRVVALALGGRSIGAIGDGGAQGGKTVPEAERHENVRALVLAGRTLYLGLTICAVLILGVAGTVALKAPIHLAGGGAGLWEAWVVVLATAAFCVWNNVYTSFLLGCNKVAVLRRWEALTAILQVVSGAAVLELGGSVVELILVTQGWLLISIFRNRILCATVAEAPFPRGFQWPIPAPILQATWPSMWRSGLGVFASQGVMYASGFIFAQWAASADLAAFLLAQRIMLVVSQFSQAPFYSRLPEFARLYAEGSAKRLSVESHRAMFLSQAVLSAFVVGTGVFLPLLMPLVGAKMSFVSASFWATYSAAVLIERMGAMHMQMYSLSNKIYWHIANGVTGSIFCILLVVLYPRMSLHAFPVAMLVSYAAIYAPISMVLSGSLFGAQYVRHEYRITGLCALIAVAVLSLFDYLI